VWFKLTDKTYYGTYIGAGGAVLTIALNFLLIPVLGYLGCAIATLVCYFAMAVLCWRLGERHFPVPYPALRLGLWLLAASGLVALGWWVQVDGWWTRHAWHAGLTVAFLAALYLVERPRRMPAVAA
jgi:O-antigen/teichoic acid export membrane protein